MFRINLYLRSIITHELGQFWSMFNYIYLTLIVMINDNLREIRVIMKEKQRPQKVLSFPLPNLITTREALTTK